MAGAFPKNSLLNTWADQSGGSTFLLALSLIFSSTKEAWPPPKTQFQETSTLQSLRVDTVPNRDTFVNRTSHLSFSEHPFYIPIVSLATCPSLRISHTRNTTSSILSP